MTPIVLDACVVAKVLFPEEGSEACAGVVADRIAAGATLNAPDLLFVEVANVAWKKVRRGEAGETDAREALRIAIGFGIRTWPGRDLAPAGLEAALATGCTAYDGLYIACALQVGGCLVTADERLAMGAARVLGGDRVVAIGSAGVR